MSNWKSLLTRFPSELRRLNWRRRAKKKHCVGLRIGHVAGFFEALNRAGIPYVVLRWFDEVPLTARAEAGCDDDVDLLVDGTRLQDMLSIAFRHRGRVRCDLYSDSGMRGTTYLSMPYYPPAMAARMLATRIVHPAGFAVPNPQWHVLSLAYHLVYHKGVDAGIPSGTGLPVASTQKRDYERLLRQFAREADLSLPAEFTLMALHRWLKSHHCSMPVDLMARWPRQSDWLGSLISHEMSLLTPWAERLSHLCLFLIREDADRPEHMALIRNMLQQRLTILDSVVLSKKQIEQALLGIRGGQWVEHKRTTVIRPVRAIVCYDFAPCPIEHKPAAKKNLYPFVENENLFVKHDVRTALNQRNEGRPLHALHGSDNAYETQHMIEVLWGKQSGRYNAGLLAQVEALRTGHTRKAA